jgi:hypothetical protein
MRFGYKVIIQFLRFGTKLEKKYQISVKTDEFLYFFCIFAYMKLRHITTLLFAFLACTMWSKDVVWFNGHGNVSYELKSKKSPIVESALEIFSSDMHQLTGQRAESEGDATIEIYELDKMKDKEFRKLQSRKLPINKVIAKQDAFYLGTDGDKVVILGSNDYGTAYGILELSRLAGVSPWIWWGDVVPAQKHYLALKSDFFTLQWPSVEKRGICVTGTNFDNKRLQEIMLRLRGNMLLHKSPAEKDGTKVLSLPENWLPSTQPGLIYYEMKDAFDHGAQHEWVIELNNPKVDAYQLSLFMDMAWNINRVNESNIRDHFGEWLRQQFGDIIGQQLLPIMTEYYHLVGINKPEQWQQEFAADAFGNELERYIANFGDVAKALDKIEKLIPTQLQDAYFAAIKYPVYCAAAMATKQLQAQEARHIGRPQSFLHDEEALSSAVRSWKAYEQILQLNSYYNNDLAGGKWKNSLDIQHNDLIVGEPLFPKKITKKEIDKYGQPEPIYFDFDTDNTITRNACEYRRASQGVKAIEMFGHSMKAIELPQLGQLSYSFYSERDGDAVIRIAAIPTQGFGGKDVSFSVKIDDNQPQIFSVKNPIDSPQWKADSQRGQAVRTIKVHLTRNSHTIDITALDDHVAIDQIMVDYSPNRIFYMFPVLPALH